MSGWSTTLRLGLRGLARRLAHLFSINRLLKLTVILLFFHFTFALWRQLTPLEGRREDRPKAEGGGTGRGEESSGAGSVVYMMLGIQSHVAPALNLLEQIKKNLGGDSPVVIFHEGNLDLSQFHSYPSVSLWALNLTVPGHVREEQLVPNPAGFRGKYATLGYRHMCRFYSGPVFHHPALLPFRFALRLDPDSELNCPVLKDPFQEMAENGYKYGYALYFYDRNQETSSTVWDATQEYLRQRGISPQPGFYQLASINPFTFNSYHRCHFWNNFELLDLDFFRSQAWQDYFDFLDQKGGFYEFRWGDALVRTLGVNLLLPPGEIHNFKELSYAHSRTRNSASCPNFPLSLGPPHYSICSEGICQLCNPLERRFRGIESHHVVVTLTVLGVAVLAGGLIARRLLRARRS